MAPSPEDHHKQPSTARTIGFFKTLGLFNNIPEASERKDFYSDIIRSLLKVDYIDRGRVFCTLKVNAAVVNIYNTLHGGAVASVAEMVGLACVQTVAGDKEFFLGEFSTAYLAAAGLDTEVEVEGSILRQGRSVVVTNIDFRIKESKKLAYTARATYYIMPAASL
ncbi:acyl-coenzyme A thioesterase 13 isoform X4 [Dendrobium catenatum]|uniref:acyl-coenzyme A thioesterase 13 isoform X4 n=1 Tax=Dendrobium catenatum TaxID=906689 RepID=UPI0009F47E23|nr:acyl-coenzyme A thioesterase 13 isoform X4 [Dendrobium catenatum]